VSLSSGDEVPHIFTRKSRLQPGEFLITSAKRLLQHNLPGPDISRRSFDYLVERRLARLDERIEGLSDEIEALARQDKGCARLMMVPGIDGCIRSRSAGWMRRCGSW
jgi:transposase